MPSLSDQKAQVNKHIQDLRRKMQLSEGESKAFYEESEAERRRNKENIIHARAHVRLLHLKIHEAKQGGEKMVERVLLSRRRVSSASCRCKKAQHTLQVAENKLHDLIKKRNLLKHKKETKEEKLRQLQEQLRDIGPEKAVEEERTIEQLKQEQIALENELDRVGVQAAEAEGVRRRYERMLAALRGEAASYSRVLDDLSQQVLDQHEALAKLRESRRSAEKTRDALRAELHSQEEEAFLTKKEREKRLQECKRRAEERMVGLRDTQGSDRRLSLLRTPLRRDSPAAETSSHEELEAELEKCHAIFNNLKEVLGVTQVEEVVERLTSQSSTKEHLTQLRSVTLEEVTRLRQEKEDLQQELARVKYEATEEDAKVEGVLEELQKELKEEKSRMENLKLRLETTLKFLTSIRAVLEHIAEKLESAGCERPMRAESPLDHLTGLSQYCNTRAQALMLDFEEESIQEKLAEMAEEQRSDGGLVTSQENIRVSFPAASAAGKGPQQQGEDGGDSGEEEEGITRKFIKRQSQMIVEAKARKRNRPLTTFKG